MEIALEIVKVMWFFLPAYFANMAPVIFGKINFLKKPINEKVFGSHKTWRGIFFGLVLALLISILQVYLYKYDFFRGISFFDYNFSNAILLGFLLGLGALVGDLTKSFFKRKVGKKPGERWFIVDQLDYVFGGLLFSAIFIRISLVDILLLFAISLVLTVAVNLFSVLLGVRKEW